MAWVCGPRFKGGPADCRQEGDPCPEADSWKHIQVWEKAKHIRWVPDVNTKTEGLPAPKPKPDSAPALVAPEKPEPVDDNPLEIKAPPSVKSEPDPLVVITPDASTGFFVCPDPMADSAPSIVVGPSPEVIMVDSSDVESLKVLTDSMADMPSKPAPAPKAEAGPAPTSAKPVPPKAKAKPASKPSKPVKAAAKKSGRPRGRPPKKAAKKGA